MSTLITGGSIRANLSLKITISDLDNPRNFGAALFYAGYATLANEKVTSSEGLEPFNDFYDIKVPNSEIRKALVGLTERLTLEMIDVNDEQIREAFTENKLVLFAREVNGWIYNQKTQGNVSGRTFSNEACYHNLLFWNLTRILKVEWIVKSEMYAGNGYFDIMVIPKSDTQRTKAYLMEIKFLRQSFKEKEEEKNNIMKEALEQINNRKYQDYFKTFEYSYIKTVKKIGILCCDCSIKIHYFD